MDLRALADLERDVAKLTVERKTLGAHFRDPSMTSWVANQGRVAPRGLTAFETATARRIRDIDLKLAQLQRRLSKARGAALAELARVPV
ncbi:MAG: hypothetical protein HC882_09170, partial [Acidobacteria bacterium]|nr:hypothetical protein [Acidobacteriota bacterium]